MPFRRETCPLLVAVSLIMTSGCQEFGAGPCEHTYRDPVLVITVAVDTATAVRIAPVFITDVTVDGHARPSSSLLTTAFGARAAGDTIVCDVPCGFGTSEGLYSFTASATGYAPSRITMDAHFARFHGGCPSFNEGSAKTSVSLSRPPLSAAPM